jgi:hypothetical protein
MRRFARIAGAAMIAAGVLTLAWAVTVWRWQDPFTALYTHWQQGRLADQYQHLLAEWAPRASAAPDLAAERRAVAREAAAFRKREDRGDAIGRIVIGASA